MKQGLPVVLDERYVWAYTAYYSVSALWGIFAIRNGILAINETAGGGIEVGFAALVTLLSTILACLTLTNAVRTEKWFTLAWFVIVSLVPASVIYQWIAEGDDTRSAGSASAFLYLIFPFARFVYLALKSRKPSK